MDTIKNWGKTLSLLSYIAALAMFFTNPDIGMGHHWIFWLSHGLIALSLYYSERRTHTALWSSVYLAVIAGMWLIPIALWWSAIPIWLIGCYNSRVFMVSGDGFALATIAALISCYFLYNAETKQQQAMYIKSHEPTTVMLKFLHVNEDGEVTTGWKGQMPIRFHPYLKVSTNEIDINKHTQVIVMNNDIIWYEQT